jgi:hypothetical protein
MMRPIRYATDHRRTLRRFACVALSSLFVLVPSATHAQLEVVVTDSAGQALADARVELWRTAQLLAVRATNAAGAARFDAREMAREMAGATDVRVRRIGYAPGHASLVDASGSIAVRLDLLARSLPSLTVSADIGACPQGDRPEARALWTRAAARYREPSFEGRHTTLDQRMGTVEEIEIGYVHDSALRPGARMYTAEGMEGSHQQLASRGYVYAVPDSHNFDLFGGWQYAPIDAELAGHFATDAFADAHTFAVAARRAAITTLRFCAKDRRRSGLDGILQLSEREGFVGTHWRFWNPRGGAEPAGGAVTFAAVRSDSASEVLSSMSGLFWRQLPSGKFLQRWQSFHEWRLSSETHVDPDAARLAGRCHPPPNYVLCAVTSVGVAGGATLSDCFSMAYRCFDE